MFLCRFIVSAQGLDGRLVPAIEIVLAMLQIPGQQSKHLIKDRCRKLLNLYSTTIKEDKNKLSTLPYSPMKMAVQYRISKKTILETVISSL